MFEVLENHTNSIQKLMLNYFQYMCYKEINRFTDVGLVNINFDINQIKAERIDRRMSIRPV